MHLYYRDPQQHGNAIFHAAYQQKGTELGEWKVINENTLHDNMISGVCPVFFDEKLWLFYPYLNIENYYNPEKMISKIPNVKFTYMGHIQDEGDTTWKSDGEYVGTIGQQKQIEGFAIRLEGTEASSYELSYLAHLAYKGDTQVCKEGEQCGFQHAAVEAMLIPLRKK